MIGIMTYESLNDCGLPYAMKVDDSGINLGFIQAFVLRMGMGNHYHSGL
jgi:hypothetical protein